MTSIQFAALLLAVASLIAPCPARHRLPTHTRRPMGRRGLVRGLALLGAAGFASAASPALLLVAVMTVVGLAVWRRRRHRARRRHEEGQLLAAALEILVGELRVGAHPLQAFTVAAAESAGPVGDSLRAVAARARLGADVVAGLESAAAESAVPAYWQRLAVFWELAVQHGLPMSVLIRAAHRDVVDRQRFAAQTGAALAGARATAAILAGLPALGIVLGQLIGAAPLEFLFGPGVGGAFLVVGVGLIGAGLWWADRIIDRLMT